MKRSEKAEYWRGQVEAWRDAGRSRADYCRQHGLRVRTFYRWERRMAKPPKSKKARSAFLRVMPSPNFPSNCSRSESGGIRLRLPGGIEIESAEYPKAAWIAEFLRENRT